MLTRWLSLKNSTRGFNLIQVSIILTVAGMLMVAVLPSYQTSLKSNQASVTKMNTVLTTLREYQAANGQLPCPADPTLAIGSANYGVASANSGSTKNCVTGTAPNAAYADATKHIAIGMIPVKTLGLSADYALDGFGRDITYAVDTNATGCQSASTQAGAITINDNGVTKNTVVALISHGADGYGAWLPLQGAGGTASRLDNGSTDTSEADNAQVAHGGGLTANGNGAFVNFISQKATSTFDDNVVYKNPQWNMSTLPVAYKLQACPGGGGSCTPASGYSYCRIITVDYTKVPNTDQPNFPVLFSGAYPYLATVANLGNVQSSSGYDIIFTSDSAGTTLLPFERENYIATSGQVNFWIQKTLSHTTNTLIYMSYGNAGATEQANPTGVWDANYKTVYHLSSLNDSTSNNNTLTTSTSPPTSTLGLIGNAYNFVSSSSQCAYSMTSSFSAGVNYTLSAWANPATTSGVQVVFDSGFYHQTTWPSASLGWNEIDMAINSTWQGTVDNDAGTGGQINSGITPTAGGWQYIVLVNNNGSNQMFINGSPAGAPVTYPGIAPSAPSIGCILNRISGHSTTYGYIGPFNGVIDEVRASASVRSADWIKAEYNNQNLPSSFYSIGPAVAR